MTPVLLDMRGIVKRFSGVAALAGVDFRVQAGQVHALMGENGAGKSTLIKVLTGVHSPDSGEIRFQGVRVSPGSPREAEGLGISTVYQEVNLLPELSVAENICLGRQPRRFGLVHWGGMVRRAVRALARLDLDLDPQRRLGSYSIAVQQLVAIARALDIEARLLVLDEPTSSLDRTEAAELFSVIRELKSKGLGIVFVSHFIDDVYEISDRITVLRNGRRVGEFATQELPRLELVRHMLGRAAPRTDSGEKPSQTRPGRPRPAAGGEPPLLSVRGLERAGSVGPLDFEVGRGEIFGLAGLLGSGRTETARLLFGIDRATQGEVRFETRPVRLRSPRDAVRLGFGFCPENRKSEGLALNLSVRENILAALQARRGTFRRLGRREQRQRVQRLMQALDIRAPGPETPVRNLSGGNQQKVLLARWLATAPRFLILDEPTRGIDVGAKAEIEKLVRELSADGVAVLFISSEIEEMVRNCTRLAVLRDRRKVGELGGAELNARRIMEMIANDHATVR